MPRHASVPARLRHRLRRGLHRLSAVPLAVRHGVRHEGGAGHGTVTDSVADSVTKPTDVATGILESVTVTDARRWPVTESLTCQRDGGR